MHATHTPTVCPPLDDLRTSFLLHLQAARRRPGTIIMCRRILGRFVRFLGAATAREPTIDDLTRDGARRYLQHRPPGLGRAVDRLFVTTTGRAMTTGEVSQICRRLRHRSGIPRLCAHLLRHTFAVHFLRNGGDPLTLQRLLGHASLSTTNRYVTLATGDLVAAHQRSSPLDNL